MSERVSLGLALGLASSTVERSGSAVGASMARVRGLQCVGDGDGEFGGAQQSPAQPNRAQKLP